jgi:hypothetical protein
MYGCDLHCDTIQRDEALGALFRNETELAASDEQDLLHRLQESSLQVLIQEGQILLGRDAHIFRHIISDHF